MRLVSWIVLLPLGLAAIVLAVANREPVRVSADPLPVEFEAPLYAVALAAILLGLVIGGVSTWMSGRKWRRIAREKRREAAMLENELRRLRSDMAGHGTGQGADGGPPDRGEAAIEPPPR